MTTQHSLLDRWYAAVKSGDHRRLAEVVTDDVVVTWNGDPDVIPFAGRFMGPAEAAHFFAEIARHLEVLEVTPLERYDSAEATVIKIKGRWRVRDTQTVVAAQAVNIFRFRDGRVAQYDVFNDSGRFAAALATAPT